MGGDVTVASEPGNGSVFTLRLPADANTPSPDSANGSSVKLLANVGIDLRPAAKFWRRSA
jgi:hypothetical protein